MRRLPDRPPRHARERLDHRAPVRARRPAHCDRDGAERARVYTAPRRLLATRAAARIFQKLAGEEKEHLSTLEARYKRLLDRDPQLESRPTFLFFKGAANGLFSEGAERLTRGVNNQQAYLVGIRCERGSHRFFKRYGEKFEDSEGKHGQAAGAERPDDARGADRAQCARHRRRDQARAVEIGQARPATRARRRAGRYR